MLLCGVAKVEHEIAGWICPAVPYSHLPSGTERASLHKRRVIEGKFLPACRSVCSPVLLLGARFRFYQDRHL
jgi:hypothetical protein